MRDRWRKKHCVEPRCTTRASKGDWCGLHDPTKYHRAYLTATPLIELVEAHGGISALTDDAGLRRAYVRAKRDGRLTEMAADRLAILALNRPPWEVWGEAWWISPSTSHSPAPIDPQDVCGAVNA